MKIRWFGIGQTIFQLIELNRYIVRIRPNTKEHLGYNQTISRYNLVKLLTSGFGLVAYKLFPLHTWTKKMKAKRGKSYQCHLSGDDEVEMVDGVIHSSKVEHRCHGQYNKPPCDYDKKNFIIQLITHVLSRNIQG